MRFSPLVDRIDAPGAAAWRIHAAAREAERRGEDVILLSVGDPDAATPAPVVDRAVAALRAGDTHYTPIAGKPALRAAVAERYRRRTNVPTGPENVMIVAGAQNGLFATALALCGAGDEVVAFEPIYATYEATIAASGAAVVRIPTSPDQGFRPRVSDLPRVLTPRTRAILLATPNNPTGVVATMDELRAVADAAIRHDLWVVVDEVYESLVFDGPHHGIRSLPGMAERTAVVGSLSKSHAMTGWRIGWVVGPPPLAAHLEALALNMVYGLPGFIQEAAIAALAEDDAVTGAMRDLYRHRAAVVADALSGTPGLVVLPPAAGMFALIDVRGTGLTSTDFAWGLFRTTGVSLLDAAAFGSATAGFVRLALAAGDGRLAEACRRIATYAGGLRRQD